MSVLGEMHEAHKARRARLWGKPPMPVFAEPEPIPEPAPEPIPEPIPDEVLRWMEVKEVCGRFPKLPYPSISSIKRIVAIYYRVSVMDMASARRTKVVVIPRFVAIYLCKQLTPLSLNSIGKQFGSRDHTTILHAIHKITRRMETDQSFHSEVYALQQEIEAAG
jgi:hypothetical protein